MKFIAGLAIFSGILFGHCLGEPVALDKPSDDDMKTSETFGYGYYQQPGLYAPPLAGAAGTYNVSPLATVGAYPAPALTTRTSLSSTSSGYARSGYGYGSGYKYGGGYGYGSRFGYGSGGTANEFYRTHPVYVAWG